MPAELTVQMFLTVSRHYIRLNGGKMEVNILFRIAAIGIIVAILNQVLSRSGRDEYTMITTLAGLIIVLMMLIPYLSDLFTYIESVFDL